ncbi:uncharacterized protein SOCG_06152 [Schizosaccharomyces octosporus yFS286]|uniref:Uncharacterized protein n=1 Tax=Schizosaccharomyces octosporus (strain yFS286) TaxID=483514 RepID=S9PW34_SCHOY|nr:uncharacterized protein SOCG_06152 [Schizosaccharomyces octosporus yFS286]EPX71683.1 hypothetical protein SOCG_06152 [Schizosaccharomyces octosporus yFS286]
MNFDYCIVCGNDTDDHLYCCDQCKAHDSTEHRRSTDQRMSVEQNFQLLSMEHLSYFCKRPTVTPQLVRVAM